MDSHFFTPSNPALWENILGFDFDHPLSEYGFTTRLIHENNWTINFAAKAILEYKKFMYLATISDTMVSPSPVIDAVWHQHLIFTQSYTQFCHLTGKFIQHVPSTHNKDDFRKFRQAKQWTRELYTENFGTPPEDIWEAAGMLENIGWPKADLKIRGFVLLGILGIMLSLVPLYYLLHPVYVKIEPFPFMFVYLLLAIITFVLLNFYNTNYLVEKIRRIDHQSFLFSLTPQELIYLKRNRLSDVIDDQIDQLINDGKLIVQNDWTIEATARLSRENLLEFQISELLDGGKEDYHAFREKLAKKPVFATVKSGMDALQKYFTKSVNLGRLFYQNFTAFAIVLVLGLVRIATGIIRDKPVLLIVLIVLVFSVSAARYLKNLTRQLTRSTIPDLYIYELLPKRQSAETHRQWAYVMMGATVMGGAFYSIAAEPRKRDGGDSGGDSGSSDNGCGSSCGSSCGGCGGGD